MKELLEAAIEGLPRESSLPLEELLQHPCPASYSFRFSGSGRHKRFEETKEARLRREVEKEHRKFLRRYLTEAEAVLGFTPVEEPIAISEVFHIPILGTLMGWPVYAHYTDSAAVAPPYRAKLISAALSTKFEKKVTCLLLVNRENLQWSAWSVDSAKTDCAAEVVQDATFVEGLVRGEAPREGIRSECITCPYDAGCDVSEEDKVEGPAPYAGGLTSVRSDRLEKMLEDHLESLNEQDDGRNTGFLSPSEISTTKCDRRLWYKRTKAERSSIVAPGLRRIFDMGHAVHEVLQRMLHEQAPDFQSEVRASLPDCSVVGSCDGVLGAEGLEIKSISHKGFDSLKRSPKTAHHRQGSIYGSSLGVPKMLYVYYNKDTGAVRFIHKDVDEEYADKIRRKANEIDDAIKQDVRPERTADYGCRMCAYTKICKPETPEKT